MAPESDKPDVESPVTDSTPAAALVPGSEATEPPPAERATAEPADAPAADAAAPPTDAGEPTATDGGGPTATDEEMVAGELRRDAVRVKLESFEGPLDLLLHLIKREKIEIHDISIAHITHQYLEMIETMQLLNLEVAGEFLVMAATLMRIKSRTLLPPSPIEEGVEDEGDPREELVRRLLEYRKYKEVAGHLRGQEETRSRQFAKGYTPRVESDEPAPLKPTSLFRLVDILRDVLTRFREQEPVHEVRLPPVTVEERMEHIRELLAGAWGQVRFEEILSDCRERIEVITTFISLLELIRLGEVVARQYEEFGDIWIFDPERLGITEQAAHAGLKRPPIEPTPEPEITSLDLTPAAPGSAAPGPPIVPDAPETGAAVDDEIAPEAPTTVPPADTLVPRSPESSPPPPPPVDAPLPSTSSEETE